MKNDDMNMNNTSDNIKPDQKSNLGGNEKMCTKCGHIHKNPDGSCTCGCNEKL